MIISDWNLKILSTVKKIFPRAYHSYCMINLSKNLMIDVWEGDATKLFFIIARALSLINAYKSWEKFIKKLSYENEKLRRRKLSYEYEKLRRRNRQLHFFPNCWYIMLTTNEKKSINLILKDIHGLTIRLKLRGGRLLNDSIFIVK